MEQLVACVDDKNGEYCYSLQEIKRKKRKEKKKKLTFGLRCVMHFTFQFCVRENNKFN